MHIRQLKRDIGIHISIFIDTKMNYDNMTRSHINKRKNIKAWKTYVISQMRRMSFIAFKIFQEDIVQKTNIYKEPIMSLKSNSLED